MVCIKLTLGFNLRGLHCEDGTRKMADHSSKDTGPLKYTTLLCKARKTTAVSVKGQAAVIFKCLQQSPVLPLNRMGSALLLLQSNAQAFFKGTGYIPRFR